MESKRPSQQLICDQSNTRFTMSMLVQLQAGKAMYIFGGGKVGARGEGGGMEEYPIVQKRGKLLFGSSSVFQIAGG